MTLTVDANGINWNYGGSKIYDDGNLQITTDDNVYINASVIIKGYQYLTNSNLASFLNTSQERYNSDYKYVDYQFSYVGDQTNVNPKANYSLITWYRIMCADEIDIYIQTNVLKKITIITHAHTPHT